MIVNFFMILLIYRLLWHVEWCTDFTYVCLETCQCDNNLGRSAKGRKVAVSFVMPVFFFLSLSASPHATPQLSLNRLLQNFVLGLFQHLSRISKPTYHWAKVSTIYMNVYANL